MTAVDWTKPVETCEDPPRPVRVLATDGPCAKFPVIAIVGNAFHREFSLDGQQDETAHVIPLHLRNVAPPKPEPVLRERWVVWDAKGGCVGINMSEENARRTANSCSGVYTRAAVMSDGSPVEEDPDCVKRTRRYNNYEPSQPLFYPPVPDGLIELQDATRWLCGEINRVADGGQFGGSIRLDRAKILGDLGLEVLARHRINERLNKASMPGDGVGDPVKELIRWKQEHKCWKAKAEALQAEVDRMRPVVDAAVIYCTTGQDRGGEKLLTAIKRYITWEQRND